MDEQTLKQMEADADEREPSDTAKLSELGTKAYILDHEISEMEGIVKEKKRELTRYLERLIPEAMAEQSLPEFGFETPFGTVARLAVAVKVVGSLRNAEDQDAAVAYLEASGFEGGVKTTLSLDYTEEEREEAYKLLNDLTTTTGKHPHIDRVIHPQTLAAFAREKIAEDPSWDYRRVGLTALTTAKFTRR